MQSHKKRLGAIERAQRATIPDASVWRVGKTPEEIAYVERWARKYNDARDRHDEAEITRLLDEVARLVNLDSANLRRYLDQV